MKEIGEKIVKHLQMIEYYRYLKQYDESFESIYKNPSPEPEPKLEVKFLKEWEKRFEKIKKDNKLKDWKLDDFEGDDISMSEFVDLFLTHCMKTDNEDIKFGSCGFFYTLLEVGKNNKIFPPNWSHSSIEWFINVLLILISLILENSLIQCGRN